MSRIEGGSVVGEYPLRKVPVNRGAYVQDERYFAIERRDARCEASQSRTAQRSTRCKYIPAGYGLKCTTTHPRWVLWILISKRSLGRCKQLLNSQKLGKPGAGNRRNSQV